MRNTKYVSKLFKMEEYIIDNIQDAAEEIRIYCHPKSRGMWFKGQYSTNDCEEKQRRIPHMMLEDKLVVLMATQRRFVFPGTKRWEKLPNVQKRKQTTNTFRLHTLRELQKDSYRHTGHKRQKSGMFPLNLLDELPIEAKWRKGVKIIGLDGKAVKGRENIHHIADLEQKKSLVIYPNLSQKQLETQLLKISKKEREEVEEVCTDMDVFYINLARKCFPGAKIVIDHFHVIHWGLVLMERLRINLQIVRKKRFKVKQIIMKPSHKITDNELHELFKCFEIFPELKVAWKIIHQLRKVYWQKDWRKANSQLRKVIWYCEQSGTQEMEDLAKTLRKFKYEILNYYRSKTTNAVTEGLHSRFESLKRIHCGIRNIERFAKRLTFSMIPFVVIAEIFARRFY